MAQQAVEFLKQKKGFHGTDFFQPLTNVDPQENPIAWGCGLGNPPIIACNFPELMIFGEEIWVFPKLGVPPNHPF